MSSPDTESAQDRLPGRLKLVHHALVLLLLSLALWISLRPWWIRLVAPPGSVVVGRTQIAGLLGAAAAILASCLHLRWWWQGRWGTHSGAEFRLFGFGLVCHWLIYLFWFQPFEPRTLWGTWTVGAGIFAVLMALRHAVTERVPGRLLHTADLAAFYLCVLIAGGEVVLRSAAWIQPSVLLTHPDEGAIRNIEARRRPPGYMRFGFPVDSKGFYDEEPSDERDGSLVVTIGDSFSQGVVPHYYHYTTVAERLLPGVEIYNVGVAGIDLREYFHLLLAEALPLDPDLVVIGVFVGNDLTFRLPPPDPSLLPRWYSADRALLFQVPKRLAALLEASIEENQLNEKSLAGESEAGPVPQMPEALAAAFPWVRDPLKETATFSHKTFLNVQTNRAHRLTVQSPDEYRKRFAYLRKIADACGDIPVLFLVIPDEFQVEDAQWSELMARSDLPLELLRSRELLFPWLEAEGLPYVDPLPALRSQPPLDDGRLHVYRLQDTHLNVRGNRVVGEALAEAVRSFLETP